MTHFTLDLPRHTDLSNTKPQGSEKMALLRHQASCHVQLGNYQEAATLLKTLIHQNPYSAIDYNNRGFVHLKLGNFPAALADLNQAIKLNPNLDRAYNNRGNYHAHQGQLVAALGDYGTAVSLNPQNIRAWINQGITLRDMELYRLAIESFDYSLYLGQMWGHIYAERGRTRHLSGDWNWAIADYHTALQHLPPQGQGTLENQQLQQRIETWRQQLLGS